MIEQVLQEIGLTQNEIKIYLALLELGESKSGEILKKSGLNSGKIYEILDSLQKKGIVSFIIKSGVKYFSPANPKRLLDYLSEKKQVILKQEEDYKSILPELLKKVSLKSPKARIEIFTGIKGMKTAYAKELEFSKSNTIYVLGVASSTKYEKQIWDFFTYNHQPKRERKGYKVKKLLTRDAKNDKKYHEKDAEIKFLPYASLVSMNIIGNLTTIGLFTEELIFISVENQEIADNFVEQFNSIWKIAKP